MNHIEQPKRLSLYSLAAGAGAVASAGALGAPIDANVSGQISVGSDTPSAELEIDISGNGQNDFRLRGSYFGNDCGYVELRGLFDGVRLGEVAVDPDFQFGGYAALIGAGESVDETLEWRQGGYLFGDCGNRGFFPPTTRGFVGLRVPAGVNVVTGGGEGDRGNGGDFFYAYADVEVTDGSLNVTIFNAFRESSLNEPITTLRGEPDRPPVPVPLGGALPLGLLLLAAGGLALRRRKQGLGSL